jgi:sulfite reductase (NADPH) hemoprotein beta-component
MYQYDEFDQTLVEERATQFRGQVDRRISGDITEMEFKPLRLQNGLYMQLHAYMLRISIPYGMLSAKQLRMLAHIARTYDRGYGHFTTRQNIQFNWPKLSDIPTILDELASVQMHAIQTSGNCVRNISSDQFAGVAVEELEDPRPYSELIRQWATFHPEFAYLPRKFKIAVTGTPSEDRTAVAFHDIGVRIVEAPNGEHVFEVLAGGGLGRTPVIGSVVGPLVPKKHLLSFLEAILRVYNRLGRRDNKFKARIKILVNQVGVPEFTRMVHEEWQGILRDSPELEVPSEEVERLTKQFAPPPYERFAEHPDPETLARATSDRDYANWLRNNVKRHKQPGYSIVVLTLKAPGIPPGDCSDTQLDAIADLSERYGFGEVRTTHTQNVVLPDVETRALAELWRELVRLDLATPNAERVTDIICCPGLDYCALASARSIPIAEQIMQRFDDVDYVNDLGEVSIKISGCINACGHHHVGNIGILGIDKGGEEFYQLLLGGSSGNDAAIGTILGPAFDMDHIVDAVAAVLDKYVELRAADDERFIETVRRVGLEPFKEAAYEGT